MKTVIPYFSGFYESIWSSAVDDAELSLAQYLTGDPESDCGEGVDGFKGRSVQEVCEALYRVVGYPAIHSMIAKAFTEALAWELDRACGWSTRIRYESVSSPREYNFTTDRIFAGIPRATVRRMRKECDAEILARVVRDNFTSHSGFHSFYSADVADWGSVDKWDHNQFCALLSAWVETLGGLDNIEMQIFEAMTENDAFSEFLDRSYVSAELLAKLNS